jgi:hypothetical protein
LAIHLENLALNYIKMGKYDDCEMLLLESKEIRIKTLGLNDLDSFKLFHLGVANQSKGNYSNA